MKFPIIVVMLLAAQGALACDLSLVAPAKSALKKPVQVKASLADDILTMSYSVTAPSLNATKVLGPKQYPLHVRRRGIVRHVFGNRISLFRIRSIAVQPEPPGEDCQSHPASARASISAWYRPRPFGRHGWDAELKIPLKPLGWDGDLKKIRGNFYSILERAPRSYWSTFLPKSQKGGLSSAAVFSTVASMWIAEKTT